MYAMIHSAESVHNQQATELARNLEWARIRAERAQQLPSPARVGVGARFASLFHLPHRTAGAAHPVVSTNSVVSAH